MTTKRTLNKTIDCLRLTICQLEAELITAKSNERYHKEAYDQVKAWAEAERPRTEKINKESNRVGRQLFNLQHDHRVLARKADKAQDLADMLGVQIEDSKPAVEAYSILNVVYKVTSSKDRETKSFHTLGDAEKYADHLRVVVGRDTKITKVMQGSVSL